MKKLVSFLLSIIFLIAIFNVNVIAQTENITVTNEEGDILAEYEIVTNDITTNSRSPIQKALNFARDNFEENRILTVTLPFGEYSIEKSLIAYSNTVFDLNNSTVFRSGECSVMLRIGSATKQVYSYDAFQNVTFKNGILDANQVSTSAIMKFEHSKNISLENLTFQNTLNVCHQLAFAACNKVNINKCNFYNMDTAEVTSNCEAVQIDVLKEQYYTNADYYDGTPTKNVTVENCNFKNVEKGIGTHTGISGHYFDNINIINNTFENVFGYAIRTVNYINSTISGNTIRNSGSGILMGNMTSSAQSNFFAPLNEDDKIINEVNNCISDNTIEIVDTGYNNITPYGINIFGKTVEKFTDSDGNDYSGDFRVSKTRVLNNKITSTISQSGFYGIKVYGCFGNSVSSDSNFIVQKNNITADCNSLCSSNSYGIRVDESDKIAICNNTITDVNIEKNNLKYGVCFAECNNSFVSANNISYALSNGIKLSNSNKAVIEKNKISSLEISNGIYLSGTTSGVSVISNSIKNCSSGIRVGSTTNTELIDNNTITNAKKYGIYITNSSKVTNVLNNKIKTTGSSGIIVNENAYSKVIKANTISKSSTNGIYISLNAKADLIDSNSINSATYYGIIVNNTAVAKRIINNTVSNSSSSSIYATDTAKVSEIANNTINNSSKNGVYITSSAKITDIKENTINKTKLYGILVNRCASVKSIFKNKISNTAVSSILITQNSIVKSVISNEINGSDTNGIYIVSSNKVNNVDYNKIENTKNYGILLSSYSKANSVSYNNITKTSYNGICLGENAVANTICANTIYNVNDSAIILKLNAMATKISNNYIYKEKFSGISLTDFVNVEEISENIIDINSKSANAIEIYFSSSCKRINNNKINLKKKSSSKKQKTICKNGILIDSDVCNIKDIYKNTICDCKKVGIYIYNAKSKAKINKNTLKYCIKGIKYSKAKSTKSNKFKAIDKNFRIIKAK